MKTARVERRIGPYLLAFVTCMTFAHQFESHAVGQLFASVGAVAPSNQDLLRRLEAAESELRYLRTRDQERKVWEQSVGDQLPAIPTSHTAVGTPTEFTVHAECTCGC